MYRYSFSFINDSLESKGTPKLWEKGFKGAGIKVAIMDTGIRLVGKGRVWVRVRVSDSGLSGMLVFRVIYGDGSQDLHRCVGGL